MFMLHIQEKLKNNKDFWAKTKYKKGIIDWMKEETIENS